MMEAPQVKRIRDTILKNNGRIRIYTDASRWYDNSIDFFIWDDENELLHVCRINNDIDQNNYPLEMDIVQYAGIDSIISKVSFEDLKSYLTNEGSTSAEEIDALIKQYVAGGIGKSTGVELQYHDKIVKYK